MSLMPNNTDVHISSDEISSGGVCFDHSNLALSVDDVYTQGEADGYALGKADGYATALTDVRAVTISTLAPVATPVFVQPSFAGAIRLNVDGMNQGGGIMTIFDYECPDAQTIAFALKGVCSDHYKVYTGIRVVIDDDSREVRLYCGLSGREIFVRKDCGFAENNGSPLKGAKILTYTNRENIFQPKPTPGQTMSYADYQRDGNCQSLNKNNMCGDGLCRYRHGIDPDTGLPYSRDEYNNLPTSTPYQPYQRHTKGKGRSPGRQAGKRQGPNSAEKQLQTAKQQAAKAYAELARVREGIARRD
jgi:hypothetical protein